MTATDSTAGLPRPATTTPPMATGRGWAWAGALGGLLGVAGLMTTGDLYDFEAGVVADNAALAAAVAERATLVWVQQAVCAVVAACLVVFAAGLRRHLAAQEPAGSLVPQVAATGVGLTAVALLVGGGISTELYWALTGAQPFDPDTIGAHVAIYNTMAWLRGGLALSAGAVALGGLLRGSVGRFLALFSALMAVLLAATQVLPVQYIAVVPGALWLIGTGAALARRTARP